MALRTITIRIRDFDVAGDAPAGAAVDFSRLQVAADGITLISTAVKHVTLTDGAGIVQLREDAGYRVDVRGVRGFNGPFWVLGPHSDSDLVTLWQNQVSSSDLSARPVPQSIEQALAAQAASFAATYATKADLAGAGVGVQYIQASPSAQWSIPHSLGRQPAVTVYDSSGSLILADIVSTPSLAVVTFANPTAGSAVLT